MRKVITENELFTISDGMYVVTDETGLVIDVNQMFCDRFFVDKEEVVGQSIQMLIGRQSKIKADDVVFGNIYGTPCLIKKIPLDSHTVYTILLRENDVHPNEMISFLHAIESKKYKRRSVNQNRYHFDDIIGESPAMQRVKDLASKIATSNSTILLTGESGTGKELFAQAIHGLSTRKEHPFIAVNCVAIPDDLFESELFGYEPGAFSGAKKDGKPGKIELAQNGTLFLDEISELSFQSQGKLLRVLQEREVERLGGTSPKQVDIRIIAATNRDLKEMVDQKEFRQDLYYRLYVFDLQIPPLRARKDDILPLAHHFINYYNDKYDKEVAYIDTSLEEWLLNYDWPGNVRELKASIERGMNIVEGDTLTLDQLYFTETNMVDVPKQPTSRQPFTSLDEAVKQAEIAAITKALKETGGDRVQAARKLKIHLSSLYRKIAKYDLK